MSMKNYFETEAEALNEAVGRATEQGAVFDSAELDRFLSGFGPVNYGQTKRDALPVVKWKDKLTFSPRAMTVVLYRMESGKYELTTYLN